jgi:hypothetical protein
MTRAVAGFCRSPSVYEHKGDEIHNYIRRIYSQIYKLMAITDAVVSYVGPLSDGMEIKSSHSYIVASHTCHVACPPNCQTRVQIVVLKSLLFCPIFVCHLWKTDRTSFF